MNRNKGFAAYPRAGALGRGVRVFLGRFPTREERDQRVREFRIKYPDMRKKNREQD